MTQNRAVVSADSTDQGAGAPIERVTLWSLWWQMWLRPRRALALLGRTRRRDWWLPALLAAILAVLPVLVSAPLEAAQAQQSTKGMMGPGGAWASPEMAAPTQPVNVAGVALRSIGQVGGAVLSWLLWAGALYLTSVFLGRSSTFGQMFRLAVWTWCPFVLRSLIQTVYILLTRQLIVNPGLSGFVLDRSTPTLIPAGPGQVALAAMLSNVDLFMVWNLVLLITGLMIITRLTRRQSILAVLVTWILLTLLSLIPAIVGNMFSQAGQIFGYGYYG